MKTIYDFMPYYSFIGNGPIISGDDLEKMIEFAKVIFENHKGPYVVCICNKQHEVVFYLEKEE